MYEGRDEAIDSLTPKSARVETKVNDSASWSFARLAVSSAGHVTHVQLTETEYLDDETESDFRQDLAELGKRLGGNSKVLLNFTGVEEFSPNFIEPIILLNQRLRTKGSFIALCCLSPAVRESFFTSAKLQR